MVHCSLFFVFSLFFFVLCSSPLPPLHGSLPKKDRRRRRNLLVASTAPPLLPPPLLHHLPSSTAAAARRGGQTRTHSQLPAATADPNPLPPPSAVRGRFADSLPAAPLPPILAQSFDFSSSAAATTPSSALCGRGTLQFRLQGYRRRRSNPLPPCSTDSLPVAPLPLFPVQAQPLPALPLPFVVGGAPILTPTLPSVAVALEPELEHPLPQRAEEGGWDPGRGAGL